MLFCSEILEWIIPCNENRHMIRNVNGVRWRITNYTIVHEICYPPRSPDSNLKIYMKFVHGTIVKYEMTIYLMAKLNHSITQ